MERLKETEQASGIITFTNFLVNSRRANEIDFILRRAKHIPSELYKKLIAELMQITETKQLVFHNQVLLAARTARAARLGGDTTYTDIINYGALGTGSTAIADSDVDLDTEVARKTVATVTPSADSVVFDFFYSKADTNGTYNEFGLVIDGTATPDSGLLYNRALTGGWVKTALESMTASIQVNILAA